MSFSVTCKYTLNDMCQVFFSRDGGGVLPFSHHLLISLSHRIWAEIILKGCKTELINDLQNDSIYLATYNSEASALSYYKIPMLGRHPVTRGPIVL